MIRRIVSGGQTGVDRAALDVAMDLGLDCGGWVPKGRRDENGTIPDEYPGLVEAPDEHAETRTALNVRDSDATLILSRGEPLGGSRFTASVADELGSPCLHVDLSLETVSQAVRDIRRWLLTIRPRVLNVAGPRASEDPRIQAEARRVLESVLAGASTARGYPHDASP